MFFVYGSAISRSCDAISFSALVIRMSQSSRPPGMKVRHLLINVRIKPFQWMHRVGRPGFALNTMSYRISYTSRTELVGEAVRSRGLVSRTEAATKIEEPCAIVTQLSAKWETGSALVRRSEG